VPAATETITRKWSYKGRRATGEMVRGIVESATHADAVRDIRRQGLAILEVELGDAVEGDEILVGIIHDLDFARGLCE